MVPHCYGITLPFNFLWSSSPHLRQPIVLFLDCGPHRNSRYETLSHDNGPSWELFCTFSLASWTLWCGKEDHFMDFRSQTIVLTASKIEICSFLPRMTNSLKHLILQKIPELHTLKSCGLITWKPTFFTRGTVKQKLLETLYKIRHPLSQSSTKADI